MVLCLFCSRGEAQLLQEIGSGWEAGQGAKESIASGDPRSPVRTSAGETAGRRVGGALMEAARAVSTNSSGDMQPE